MEPTLRTINAVISALFFICYTYQFLYIPLVLLKKRRPLPCPAAPHRYAVLIAARNEENVIAGLLDSLAAQTYDMSLVTVFVAADNCTDSTAAIAREHGAVVYERFNHVNVGKGYALDFLLQHIGADYPEGFDGYFVFDADNILSPDFLERMNESFSAGNEIVTSYRNSKNFGDQLDQRRVRPVVPAGEPLSERRTEPAGQQCRRGRDRLSVLAADTGREPWLAVLSADGGYRVFHPPHSTGREDRHLRGCGAL